MSHHGAHRTGINTRALASMALFCAGVWSVPSGIALHVASHDSATRWTHLFMTMHNTASLLFLLAAVTHVITNWKALTRYVIARAGEYMQFRRELSIAVLVVSCLILFAASHVLCLQ